MILQLFFIAAFWRGPHLRFWLEKAAYMIDSHAAMQISRLLFVLVVVKGLLMHGLRVSQAHFESWGFRVVYVLL